jgi:class 3 adenylate cyclase/tetratricopeptide (TPR) repeat protein
MVICSRCAHENPDGNKYCGECASPLGSLARAVAHERKVVSSLFCDLVGYTATAETADPEDVDRMLAAYFEVARTQVERHGGVVEKFIGDAVLGVFGVPAAHEDDPERAVRAGLRIVEDAQRLGGVDGTRLRLRVGINTGEALVRIGVSAASGEGFLTGDAVNTAARIQSVAPVMGVAVGLTTFEATRRVFDYEELEPALLKGKAEHVRVFRAKAPRARIGTELPRANNSPFVGREIDLRLLKGVFDKTMAAGAVQLVTVVGEPGLGKSRIVAELLAHADAQRELVTWRQGRCLPYGEGIAFWALGEMLKAHTGVLESDSPEVASKKLDALLPRGPEREWFRQRLLPLLGIEASSSAEREELFTAWRRFFELVAQERPTVLVFEDLHWADDALLAFVEYLADDAEGVPLLLVGTARPELYEHHAAFAAGLRNATPINLAPLSKEETTRLVSGLLDTTVLPAELRQLIVDRAGGNPLFAEEFVRLLKDSDLLVQSGSSWVLREGAEVPFPDSIQALIAARLDTLDPDTKSMLADAAVVGKVFWAGALGAMGGRDPQAVSGTLRNLSRKELVWPARRSSMEGEAEYAFGHVLVRDVAYQQLPRASRASRHLAAATWTQAKVAGRVEDFADVLAYHYATALELAQAAGQTEQAAELEMPALRFLILTGERALGLDTAAALGSFERALALTPPGHPDRPRVLAGFGEAALQAARNTDAAEALEEAIAAFRAAGDLPAATRAAVTLSEVFVLLGDPRRLKLLEDMVKLLEPLPSGPELVSVLAEMADAEALQGRAGVGLAYAERALSLAEELGLEPARALGVRGQNRGALGDPGALDDFREAIALATRAGLGRETAILYNNFAVSLGVFEGAVAALEAYRAGIAFAEERGITSWVTFMTHNLAGALAAMGEFDEVLEINATMAERAEKSGNARELTVVRSRETRIRTLRGEADRVATLLDWLESQADETMTAQHNMNCLEATAVARAALGQDDAAAALLARVAALPGVHETGHYISYLPACVRLALSLDTPEVADRLTDRLEAHTPHTPSAAISLASAHAALAEARGEPQAAADGYAIAAEGWQGRGVIAEQAFALLGQGRCLNALGQPVEAALALEQARAIFHNLKAAPALAEADALLQSATSDGRLQQQRRDRATPAPPTAAS